MGWDCGSQSGGGDEAAEVAFEESGGGVQVGPVEAGGGEDDVGGEASAAEPARDRVLPDGAPRTMLPRKRTHSTFSMFPRCFATK